MRAKSWTPDDEPAGPVELDPFALAANAFATQTIPVLAFYDDPVGFVDEFVDFSGAAGGTQEGLTVYQREIMDDLPKYGRMGVRGPHGLGKTTTNALTVLWFALTSEAAGKDWKCATTAGAWRQLEHYLWPEIRKWAGKLRWDKLGVPQWNTNGEMNQLSLNLAHGSAFAVASSDEKKIEGVHADRVLYIFDESKAIRPAVFDAAEGAFSGAARSTGERPTGDPADRGLEAYAVATSTPGEPQGRFYEIHSDRTKFRAWHVRHVKLREVIDSGRISEDWSEDRKLEWGEDSALYANRALGEFHSSADDAVIPLSWVEAAVERWYVWQKSGRRKHAGTKVLGVDVALGGADFSAISHRRGDITEMVEKLNLADTVKVARAVQDRMAPGDDSVVDSIGVGAGVLATLKERGVRARPFTASKKSWRKDRSGQRGFINRRSEMWWGMRERLDPAFGPTIALPPDDQLMGELTAPKWTETAAGKIVVESKKDIKKRIDRSTDTADAVLMAYASPESVDDESPEAQPGAAVPLPAARFSGGGLDSWEPGGGRGDALAFGTGQSESFYQWERELFDG